MTAEHQIWLETLKREKQRVDNIHKTAEARGQTSAAQFLPKRVTKPWTWSRSGPGPLFDLDDALMFAVTDLDYDLDDPEFVTFLSDAAQLHICRLEGRTYWNLLQAKSVSREEFIENPDLQYAQEYEGQRYKYSFDEMKCFWRIFLRTRVYLQGAYDCYRGRETTAPVVPIESGAT